MSSEPRGIVLQNDDTSITYVGEWTTVQASVVSQFGNFGPAFSPTLRSTKTISSFVFPFQGSAIWVFGTVNITNFSNNPNPTWQCFLDGFEINPGLFQFPENNWPLCDLGSIPDGSHELIVNVTSNGMPFYLDYLEYRSSANVSRENTLISIDNPDPAIDYISGWSALGSIANQTTDPDGLVNVTFVGTQLAWYGIIPTEESHTAASGEYSIDGGPFAPFKLSGLPLSTTTTFYNQLFFTTPTLEMSSHVLSVKYTGQTQGQTPLTLDYLIVTNGTFPSSASSGDSDRNGTGTQSHTSSTTHTFSIPTSSSGLSDAAEKKPSNVGDIVGGVIGVILAVALAIIIFLVWFRRRKRRQAQLKDSSNGFIPSYTTQTHPPTFLPPLRPSSPLETSEFSKARIRYASQLTESSLPDRYSSYSYSTTTNPITNTTSFYATTRVSSIASFASSIIRTAVRRPLRSAPALVVRKKLAGETVIDEDVVQHEDSGIRLPMSTPMPVVGREKDFPTYIISNNTSSHSESFT